MQQARSSVFVAILAALTVGLAACGGDEKADSDLGREAKAACSASPLSAAVNLPPAWPQMGEVTFTQQATQGPTEVVEGYFAGDVEAAHDDFERELEAAGFTILFEELEADDAEVSWKGQGRSGQVALREECGEEDKTYVHITNRPG